jgi:coenzyme F420-reducing hydrogenase beta subunit
LNVCPFSDEHGQNEDSLGEQWFGADAGCTHYDSMGWVRDSFVGGVADESQRFQAASGGLTTAVLCQLLKSKDIDAAIVLQPFADRPWYRFRVADTEKQILASRGSVYHVVPLEKVISDVLAGPERCYAVVALPCTAKALRLAQNRVPALQRRLRYVLGLTCGGYRSLLFADVLRALMGRSQGLLRYRSKRYARTARDYRAEMATDQSVRSVRMLGLFGYLWINEVGGLQSCLFCDDVFAELADATFMDAWLPEYHADRRGTNLVISRNEKLSAVLTELFDTGECEGEPIAPEKVAQSQGGLLDRRRNLLAARCHLAEETLGYAPRKRLAICPPYCRKAQQAHASRDLAFFRDVRNELLRYRERLCEKRGWLARWHAWRLCWRVLVMAGRHGILGRTFRATKYLSPKPTSLGKNAP